MFNRLLDRGRSHWFSAEFDDARFRLFFRYDSRSKIVIFQ